MQRTNPLNIRWFVFAKKAFTMGLKLVCKSKRRRLLNSSPFSGIFACKDQLQLELPQFLAAAFMFAANVGEVYPVAEGPKHHLTPMSPTWKVC